MKVEPAGLPGVLVITPEVHGDARGFFLETFRENRLRELLGPDARFVQHNHSRSRRGVLRGLHFQHRRPQGKLVRCLRGEIFDVAVAIDPASDDFGRWFGVRLDDQDHRQLYVPPGYAHGFQVLSEAADVEYKCTDYYDPGGEAGLLWNDPEVGIDWPLPDPELSVKDRGLPTLADLRRRAPPG